jgi:hypothetical protein
MPPRTTKARGHGPRSGLILGSAKPPTPSATMNKHDLKEHQHHCERAQAAQILLFVAFGTAADAARTAHEATNIAFARCGPRRATSRACGGCRRCRRIAFAVASLVDDRCRRGANAQEADLISVFLPDHAFGNASGFQAQNSFFSNISIISLVCGFHSLIVHVERFTCGCFFQLFQRIALLVVQRRLLRRVQIAANARTLLLL